MQVEVEVQQGGRRGAAGAVGRDVGRGRAGEAEDLPARLSGTRVAKGRIRRLYFTLHPATFYSLSCVPVYI